MSGCQHAKTKRGDDIPRRWGSFRSEVCVDCGAYRYRTHRNELWDSRWRPEREYAEDIRDDEDE